eukprot:6181750-Pleurochrysis_carterae.AAC.3
MQRLNRSLPASAQLPDNVLSEKVANAVCRLSDSLSTLLDAKLSLNAGVGDLALIIGAACSVLSDADALNVRRELKSNPNLAHVRCARRCKPRQTCRPQGPSGLVPSQMRNGVKNGPLASGAKAPIGTKTGPDARLAATNNLTSPGRARPTRAQHWPHLSLMLKRRRERTQLSVHCLLNIRERLPSPQTRKAGRCVCTSPTRNLASSLIHSFLHSRIRQRCTMHTSFTPPSVMVMNHGGQRAGALGVRRVGKSSDLDHPFHPCEDVDSNDAAIEALLDSSSGDTQNTDRDHDPNDPYRDPLAAVDPDKSACAAASNSSAATTAAYGSRYRRSRPKP